MNSKSIYKPFMTGFVKEVWEILSMTLKTIAPIGTEAYHSIPRRARTPAW